MRKAHANRTGTLDHILLCGRRVDFRRVCSRTARKLRVRVGITGVEVIQPEARSTEDVSDFLQINGAWIIDQLQRIESLILLIRHAQAVRATVQLAMARIPARF
jgi:predicted metal-dependent hydrolase